MANWKMNLPAEGFEAYGAALAGRKARADPHEIVVAPPYPFLGRVADAGMSAGFTVAVIQATVRTFQNRSMTRSSSGQTR